MYERERNCTGSCTMCMAIAPRSGGPAGSRGKKSGRAPASKRQHLATREMSRDASRVDRTPDLSITSAAHCHCAIEALLEGRGAATVHSARRLSARRRSSLSRHVPHPLTYLGRVMTHRSRLSRDVATLCARSGSSSCVTLARASRFTWRSPARRPRSLQRRFTSTLNGR